MSSRPLERYQHIVERKGREKKKEGGESTTSDLM